MQPCFCGALENSENMEHFKELILYHETVTQIPKDLIKYLYKQGVYVRPNSAVKNKVLPAFVMEQGKEREINILLQDSRSAHGSILQQTQSVI